MLALGHEQFLSDAGILSFSKLKVPESISPAPFFTSPL